MPQRAKNSGDALGNALGTGWVEVAWGKPREIRFRITNINPNNHSPISMELLGNGSGVMVVVASTNSRDRTPPVSWYPQLLRPREESFEELRLDYSSHPKVSE